MYKNAHDAQNHPTRAPNTRIWNKYARSLLQLRYGGRACWVHAGAETDRLLFLPRRRPDESREGRRDSLATSTSSSSAFSTTTAAAPPIEGPKACMIDVFDAPAEHSLVYEMRETDCVLVNVGADYELYALMSAAPDLQETIQGLNRLIRAIKRDERFLFQVDAVYW